MLAGDIIKATFHQPQQRPFIKLIVELCMSPIIIFLYASISYMSIVILIGDVHLMEIVRSVLNISGILVDDTHTLYNNRTIANFFHSLELNMPATLLPHRNSRLGRQPAKAETPPFYQLKIERGARGPPRRRLNWGDKNGPPSMAYGPA